MRFPLEVGAAAGAEEGATEEDMLFWVAAALLGVVVDKVEEGRRWAAMW